MIVGAGVLAEGDPQLGARVPGGRRPPPFRDPRPAVQVRNRQGLCGKEALGKALARWNDQQVKVEREKKSDMIEHIFKEYKSERGKEVRKGG